MNVKNYKTGVSWRLLLPPSQGAKITAVFSGCLHYEDILRILARLRKRRVKIGYSPPLDNATTVSI
jgi:hypothetical protein